MKGFVNLLKRLKKFLSRAKSRIFILVCLVSLLPLSTAIIFLYNRSVYSMMKQAADIAHSTISVEIEIADNAFSIVDYWSTKVVEDEDIAAICEDSSEWGYNEEVVAYQKAENVFKRYISLFQKFDVISNDVTYNLYLYDKKIVFDSSSTFYNEVDAKNVNFMNSYENCKERWTSTTKIDQLNLLGKNYLNTKFEQVVTKCYDIVDDNGKVVGVLAANVSSDLFENYYNEIQKGLSGDTIIIDNYDNLILSSDTLLSEAFMNSSYYGRSIKGYWGKINLNNENYLLVSGSLQNIDSMIYVLVPIQSILENIINLKEIYLLLMIITAFFVLVIANIITKLFYKPIGTLKEHMYLVEQGNLNTKITEIRKDDLQDIYNSFNDMTEKLDYLIHEVTTEKLLNEEAELKLLQAQINPHFLYNTFDSIYSIAKLNKVDQISNMVAALSRFFRISLSGGKNIVTMKEAVEIAESYLIIQNIRFINKIQYSINVEEALWNMKVPKLILQPIVENAVYHGLERKKGQGTIELNAIIQKDYAFITIEDDGMGIEAAKLEEIKESLYSENVESKYYAMCNLARQLKLLYKESYIFNIESVYGKGTLVTIVLPINYDLKEAGLKENVNSSIR